MGPESYKHRFADGEFRLSNEWFNNDEEINNLWIMIEKDELPFSEVDSLYHTLLSKVNIMSIRPAESRSAQGENRFQTAKETLEKLQSYRKKLKDRLDSGIISHEESIN